MIITDFLAKGLASRLFDEYDDPLCKFNIYEDKLFDGNLSREQWKRAVEKFNLKYEKYLLSHYHGGSKRKPFVGYGFLSYIVDRKFPDWNERCLCAPLIFTDINGNRAEEAISFFGIGEHAIARFYERSKVNFLDYKNQIDVLKIIPHLRSIPLWASFWYRTFDDLFDGVEEISEIYPVIPTESGLFVAEVSNAYQVSDSYIPAIEIRTFLGDNILTQQQLIIKNLLLSVGAEFENSPLSLHPLFDEVGVDQSVTIHHIISYRLRNHWADIADVIFYKVSDPIKRTDSKNKFISKMQNHIAKFDPYLDELASKLYLREFQILLNAN